VHVPRDRPGTCSPCLLPGCFGTWRDVGLQDLVVVLETDVLRLELTDPGFDFSVLSEFRDRLVGGDAGRGVLDAARDSRLVGAGERARTNSTHVLSSARELNGLEQGRGHLAGGTERGGPYRAGLADRPCLAQLVHALRHPEGASVRLTAAPPAAYAPRLPSPCAPTRPRRCTGSRRCRRACTSSA
jgi:hypothetical protein